MICNVQWLETIYWKHTFPMAIADEVAGLDDTPETPLAPPPAIPTALSTAISVRTKEER